MREFLDLLKQLEESDIEWLFSSGNEMQVIANTIIVQEAKQPDALYIVLEGLLGLRVASVGERILRTLGPGEIIGEMSLLDNAPASATVFAVENTLLLALPRPLINSKLEEDTGFAARLYRSFAILLSGRLRAGFGTFGRMLQDKGAVEASVHDRWETISKVTEEFKSLLEKADREALRNQGDIPDDLTAQIRTGFRAFCDFINEQIGDNSPEHPSVREELGLRLKREVLPYVLLTGVAERFYSKPRGYAGDFMTIEMIYQNEGTGSGRIGPLLDRCFLDEPAAVAVRNRRGLLAEEIGLIMNSKEGDDVAKVTSLACGPAEELFDVYKTLDNPGRLRSTLIDIDLQALAFVGDKRDRLKLKRFMTPVNANLVYLATGRQELDLANQDLAYSIGLIDYFDDKFVIALLNYLYKILRPGGKVILGNFHPKNPTKALMDHILDWRLIHRTEEDMNRLYMASSFKRPCTNIRFEDQGVNLFAECIKQ